MNKNEIIKLLDKAMEIAGEALYLAEEYSGGESETAQELCRQFEKLEVKYCDIHAQIHFNINYDYVFPVYGNVSDR